MLFVTRAGRGWAAALLLALQCGGPAEARVESVAEPVATLDLRLKSLTGFRDGDRFVSSASFSGGSGSLSMEMNFRIGVPTVLTGGAYRFESSRGLERGTVQARSVTFLGGQSDRPNLGGVFLLRSQGTPRYRVVIPTMETRKSSQGRRPESPVQSEPRN